MFYPPREDTSLKTINEEIFIGASWLIHFEKVVASYLSAKSYFSLMQSDLSRANAIIKKLKKQIIFKIPG